MDYPVKQITHRIILRGPGVRREEHELIKLVLLCVDAVHNEVLLENCPLNTMSETNKNYGDEKKYTKGGRKRPSPPPLC